MAYIQPTQLENASVDAETLDIFVNGAAGASNINRAGDDVSTLMTIKQAALLSSGIYDTTVDGLAATTEGQYFSAPTTDGSAFLVLYKNVSGAAVAKGRAPSDAVVTGIETADQLVEEQPNLFSRDQLEFKSLPTSASGSTIAASSINGRRAAYVVGGAVDARCSWGFPADRFPSGEASAQVTVESATSGSGGAVRIYQRNAANAVVKTDNLSSTSLSAAIDAPVIFRGSGITIDPAAVTIELDVTLIGAGRQMYVRGMMIADGESSGYRFPPPPPAPSISYFPAPALTAEGSSQFAGETIIEDGEAVLSFSGAGTLQAWYDVMAAGVYAPGSTLTFSALAYCDVTGNSASADISIICLDSGGGTIATTAQANVTQAAQYQELKAARTIPAGTATVRFRFVKRSQAALAKFKRPLVSSDAPGAMVINAGVTSSGGGSGIKTVEVSPGGGYATIQAGIEAVKPFGNVIVREGDYSIFNISGFSGLVSAYRGERVRVMNGTKLTGITKTTGYTAVYQAALAVAPNHYLFEHETPEAETLIAAAERHPLQRGKTHRLESTRLFPVADIQAVDDATHASWYYDAVAKIVYFRTSDGAAPGVREYYAPAGTSAGACVAGGSGTEDISIIGISAWYGYNGFRLSGISRLRLYECEAMYSWLDGFSLNDNRIVENTRPRAGGNGNDGTNGHGLITSTYGTQNSWTMTDAWCHDNWDDGDSIHERCNGSYSGGLFENNGSGIATAYGAHVTLQGGLVRKNGMASGNGNPAPKDLGVSAIGASTDGGVGTQVICYGTVSEDNGYNFVANSADNSMICVDTKSFRGSVAGYSGGSGGAVLLHDAGDTDSAVAKNGNVTVENTTLVS